MTTDLIAQAEAALDGVTPGEWRAAYSKWEPDNFIVQTDHPCRRVLAQFDGDGDGPDDQSLADARFIAWTRAGVPALIARVRELEGERDAERKAKQELALDVIAASGQAQEAYEAQLAAEAKLAEAVKMLDEKDRNYNRLTNDMIERHAATVATITAPVDAPVKAADGLLLVRAALDSWRRVARDGRRIDPSPVGLGEMIDVVDAALDAIREGRG